MKKQALATSTAKKSGYIKIDGLESKQKLNGQSYIYILQCIYLLYIEKTKDKTISQDTQYQATEPDAWD